MGVGEIYAAYVGAGGVLGEIKEDGFLELAIQKAPDTPTGSQMFNEALAAFGNKVEGIRGAWFETGSMRSNFDAFKAGIEAGLTPTEAALQKFTGKMAARNGFRTVRIIANLPGQVVVEFLR